MLVVWASNMCVSVRSGLEAPKKIKKVPGWKFETLKHARDLNTPVSPVSNARAYMLNASLSESLSKAFSVSKQCLVRMKGRKGMMRGNVPELDTLASLHIKPMQL